MSVYTMPSLGADMEAGTLVEWLVAPGDVVARGDVVAVVETQKGAIEIEIFDAGEVVELIAQPGQTLPVGAPLARLRGAGEAQADVTSVTPDTVPVVAPRPVPARRSDRPDPVTREPAHPTGPRTAGSVLASPAARARAAAAGVDPGLIRGSGPDAAVLLADVERYLAAAPGAALAQRPAGKPGLDLAEMRSAIAAAMSRSKREIPHYYLSHQIDLQAAQDWLTTTNAARPPEGRLLMGALLVRATVRALAEVPEFNGRFEGADYVPAAAINCGVAIALRGGGLIAPALLDAQEMSLDQLMAAMRDLVARARTGRLRNSEVTQGTITVSSLGEAGVDSLTGVIYPPQVALVGFGTPQPRPWVHDGRILPRMSVTATLAADHRVSDGRRGALFLAGIARALQEPDR
jgi:pyruvate dehydrogenase E2 component (dihydrolipoamide acetyltransferase)